MGTVDTMMVLGTGRVVIKEVINQFNAASHGMHVIDGATAAHGGGMVKVKWTQFIDDDEEEEAKATV